MVRLLLFLTGIFLFQNALASDHFDGPITKAHKSTDLAGFYVFPNPAQPNLLTLILDVHPFAQSWNHFQENVYYDFLISQAHIQQHQVVIDEQQRIRCEFKTPGNHASHTINCRTQNGITLTGPYGNVIESEQGHFKLYSNRRSDPFFFSWRFAKALGNGIILEGPFDNDTRLLNILNISIEIDIHLLFEKPGNLFLASAVSRSALDENARFDRVGRAEITNGLLAKSSDTELRDSYNSEWVFNVNTKNSAAYQARIKERIQRYDSADGTTHWANNDLDALAKLLVDDYVILDIAKPCNQPSFFEIERALLNKTQHTTCGGRKLGDDIVDIMFTYFVNKNEGQPVSDGIDAPYKKPKPQFPYLREPTLCLSSTIKAYLGQYLDFTME